MIIQQRRVVVTGVGLVSPVGIGTEATWNALLQGESGIGAITLFDASGFSCKIAGEVKDFSPEEYIERKEIKKMGRFIQFALAASEFAVKQAGLDMAAEDPGKVGVYVGSGIGAFEVIEREHSKLLAAGPHRVSPFFITATIANLAAGQISIRYGATGPNLTCATACTTGAHAIGESFRVIQRGDADVMICGGSEAAVTPLSVAGFASMRALSTRNDDPATASRPWDEGRDGFVVGEGAGILILEEYEHAVKRGATILSELVGYAANSDAYHTNAPPEDGRGVRRVMELALLDAEVEPEQNQVSERACYFHAPGRSRRSQSDLRYLWRVSEEPAGELDQVDDRPSAGWGGQPGSRDYGARSPGSDCSTYDKSAECR